MRIKSVLPNITFALLAAAESHPLRRSAEMNLTSQNDMSFNLDTMPFMTNVSNEYLPSTRLKKRLGEEELKRRTGNEAPVPITVKLNMYEETYQWTGKVMLDRGRVPAAGPQSFRVVFHTIFGDFQLFSSALKGSKDLNLYEPLKAEQLVKTIQLAGGVERRIYKDAIQISGVRLNNIYIAGLSGLGVPKTYAGDGYIGMPFTTNPTVSPYHIFRSLTSQHPRLSNVFAFYFGPHHAELHLGGIKSSAYTGEIVYYNIIQNQFLLWIIGKGNILIGGTPLQHMEQIFMHTGSHPVYGPYELVKSIYGKIGGVEVSVKGQPFFSIPCGQRPKIFIKFTELTTRPWAYNNFVMRRPHGICFGGIQPRTYSFAPNAWSIGTGLLNGKYAIFDEENKKFGLAEAATSI